MNLFKLWGEIGVRNTDAIQAIDETTGAAQGAESRMSSAFKKIGAAVAGAFAVDKIVSFGKEIVNVAAEVSAEASAFDQIMGDYSEQASEKVQKIADATGMVSTRLTPYMTSMTAKFKGLGYDIDNATTLASDGLNLAADAAAFWDKSLDDSMSHLNSFINGSYEGGEAIGLFANDTQMAMYAVEQGIVESTSAWSSLDEATKQATRLEYAQAMYDLSGATGQAAKESGQYANVQANLTEKWRQFKAQIGEPIIQSIVIPALEKLSGLVDTASAAFQKLKTWVSENSGTLENLAAVIGVATAALIAYKGAMLAMTIIKTITTALNGMTVAQYALNLAMSLNPIGLIVAAIAGLVAAFAILWNKSEEFRNFWINLWEGIKSAFEPVITFITNTFNSIKEKIQSDILPALQEFWSAVQDNVLPVLSSVWDYVQIFIQPAFEWLKTGIENLKIVFSTAFEAIKTSVRTSFENIKVIITTVWDNIKVVVSTALNVIKGVINLATSVIKGDWQGAWNAIKSIFSSIWNGIKSVVTNVWNAIKSIFSNSLNSVKTNVSTVFNGIKSVIQNTIDGAKNIVSTGLNAIKSFFSNLTLKFPDIKLPHFSITGSFSLSPPSVPKLSVSWYAKGGILNEPTLFDYNPTTGKAKVGGEAGAEAIAPIDTLLGYVKAAVREENSGSSYQLEKLTSMLAEYMPKIINGANRQVVLDSGVLVGEIAPQIDSKLGSINELRKRGR